jgi:hypothetical protein
MALTSSIFSDPHHQSLELVAAKSLAVGEYLTAYKLADRRCRISPLPQPHCYVLRSDAAFHLGEQGDAVLDLIQALDIAPEDLAANRPLLAWGNQEQKLQAANALVGIEHNFGILRTAVGLLQAVGQHQIASVRVWEDAVEGWIAWRGTPSASVEITDDTETIITIIEPDPDHPLSSVCQAAGFRLSRPKSQHPHSILIATAGRPGHVFLHSSSRQRGRAAPSVSRHVSDSGRPRTYRGRARLYRL